MTHPGGMQINYTQDTIGRILSIASPNSPMPTTYIRNGRNGVGPEESTRLLKDNLDPAHKIGLTVDFASRFFNLSSAALMGGIGNEHCHLAAPEPWVPSFEPGFSDS